MASKKRPLEAVRTVRAGSVDRSARALSEAVAASRLAQEAAERARVIAERSREETARALKSEASAIAASPSPAELAQLAAFEVGRAIADERLRDAAGDADAKADARKAAENERRRDLVRTQADLEVVDRYREKLQAAAMKREDERVDEAAEEAHAARRR